MMAWTPAEWTELVKAVFFGVSTLCIPLATVYIMLGAARAKRAETASLANAASIATVSTNVDRLEKNTNSISERNQAIAMKLGIKEGIEQERSSVQAANTAAAPTHGTSPLPVTDARAAEAAEDSAKELKRMANAAEAKKPEHR